jgi:hypothetical protein
VIENSNVPLEPDLPKHKQCYGTRPLPGNVWRCSDVSPPMKRLLDVCPFIQVEVCKTNPFRHQCLHSPRVTAGRDEMECHSHRRPTERATWAVVPVSSRQSV